MLLDPEVASAFPDDAAVNEALRAVLHAARMVERGRHDVISGPPPLDSNVERLLEGGSSMRVTRNLGMLLLGIWLILTGLVPLLGLSFSGLGTVMAILAVASGALIVTGR